MLIHTHKKEVAGAQTLRKGLSVLRLFTRIGPSGLRMSEVCRQLEMAKATAIRLTLTLVEEGYLVHDQVKSRYRLGPEAFAMGIAAEPSYEMQRLAAPTLRMLADETEDTVFFTVLHGHESICLSRDEGDFPIRNQLIKVGDRWPLGVGGGSCALLAAFLDETIEYVLKQNSELRAKEYPKCTDAAIMNLIREARETGYCVQPGMVLEDSWAIGVAVLDAYANPIASISVAAIRSRLNLSRRTVIGNRLVQASRELTTRLVSTKTHHVNKI